jgi:hypothetical protein
MEWIKSILQSDIGRSIGTDADEAVYFNPNSGVLIIKNSNGYSISTIAMMSQYKVVPVDFKAIDEILGIKPELPPVEVVSPVKKKKK